MEAVTGVVGRAELLSAVFVFASLLTYLNTIGAEEMTLFSGELLTELFFFPARGIC